MKTALAAALLCDSALHHRRAAENPLRSLRAVAENKLNDRLNDTIGARDEAVEARCQAEPELEPEPEPKPAAPEMEPFSPPQYDKLLTAIGRCEKGDWAAISAVVAAVGETAILRHPLLASVGVSIWMWRGRQQNDSLADG